MQDSEATDAVVLRFTLTREDVIDAVAAQYRVTQRPWYLGWWFIGLLIAVGVLSFVALLPPVAGGRFPAPALALPLIPLIIAVMYANPRLLFRSAARQLMRGTPALSAPTTITVSAAGVRSSNAMAESAVNWAHYPYYTDAGSMFVLFTSDRLGGMMQVLPKRGLSTMDPEPLRALVAAHAQRLG